MKMAVFRSRCENQVLCIKPARIQIVDGIAVPVPGEHIRFERGECVLDDKEDKEKIAFIRKHRLFGTAIVEVRKSDTQPVATSTPTSPPADPPKDPQ